ncbi:KTSC domain-containing protein [Asaia sp. BMEF1]|uniref:KTSC domain-containing protein n=1 Tax=Asaia sp. BMEF1 TaxID=3155932 RepID=UPI003F67ECE8
MPLFPESSAIAYADYDAFNHILNIKFRHGIKTYSYVGVPHQVYDADHGWPRPVAHSLTVDGDLNALTRVGSDERFDAKAAG